MSFNQRGSVLFFILVFIAFTATAQTTQSLLGRWEYQSVRKVGSSDILTASALRAIVGDNPFFDFQSQNRYTAFVNGQLSRGTWVLQKDGKLALTPSKGTARIFELVTVNSNTLVLLTPGEAYHTLIRNKKSIVAAITPEENVVVPAIRPEEIIKKWVLVEMHDSLELQTVNERMTSFVKGGWYDLRADGGYTKKMVSTEKTGKWKLTEGNRTIIMMDDDGFGTVWNIGYVSSSKMILMKPNSTMKHIFLALQ